MNSSFDKYSKFVDEVTSKPSKEMEPFIYRLQELSYDIKIERLLTAAIGISAEGGEFAEIVKKMVFQGKPWNDANKHHLVTELGDIMWYVANACMALEVSFDDVVATNVKKLEKRYPGGSFDVFYSENRQEGDL